MYVRTAKEDIRENIAKVERLIANETHSEYFAMVSALYKDRQ